MKMMQLIETNRMVPISQFCKKCLLRVSAFGRQYWNGLSMWEIEGQGVGGRVPE